MLVEISCDKFIDDGYVRPTIKLNPGFNVVLGDESATNSIGKSTFLLIIDFVFGGDDYLDKARDVHDNVGRHAIKFSLMFNNEQFYFIRDTVYYRSVSVCDAEYKVIGEMTISKYREFLRDKYQITQQGLSFRDLVSRYSRIYQRDNLDEKSPLSVYKGEPKKDCVQILLKLFDCYSGLEELEEALQDAEDKYATFHDAISYNYIPAISTKRELKRKQQEMDELKAKQEDLANPEIIKQRSVEELTRISELKKRVQLLRAKKSRLESRLNRLELNLNVESVPFQTDFQELGRFFPEVDLKKLSEIETFHSRLTEILKAEILHEQQELQGQFAETRSELETCETEIKSFDIPLGISRKVLDEYTEIAKEVEKIKTQTSNYDQEKELKENRTSLRNQLTERKALRVQQLQGNIDDAMRRINDSIYDGRKKAPILTLAHNNYNFSTPDDTGTGIAYKGLVVFDLAILQLTNLPFLIHDSLIFKNIADTPLEKILGLYQNVGKQIFIALDKSSSYTERTQGLLEDSAVLRLSNNGHELFGWSWGDKNAEQ